MADRSTRLTLITQLGPPPSEAARFADSDMPSSVRLPRRGVSTSRLGRSDLILCAPDIQARHTAEALGLQAEIEPGLRVCDFGQWRGRSLGEVAAVEPDRFALWLCDPGVAPPDGESATALTARIGEWLEVHADGQSRLVVVHPMVVRAAAVHAAAGTANSWFRLDVGFLSKTVLTHSGAFWRVQQLNADL